MNVLTTTDYSTLVETDTGPAPELWQDAEVIGDPDADLTFLDRPVTFMLGEFYKSKDPRNTADGRWQPINGSFRQFIDGFDAAKKAPEWGLARHPVGKEKEGMCIVLGESVGRSRKAKAMSTMYATGLDIDSGASLDAVLNRIEELGIFCVAYTTFSHGKRGLDLPRDEVLRKLKVSGDLSLDQIKQYLREHSKDRYEEHFLEGLTILHQKKQTTKGIVVRLDSPSLDKFRLIFPLAEPVHLIDLADTQAESLTVWENKVTGLARNLLGVHFDTSCTDPSRLFFLPRHPKDGEWGSYVVRGRPLTFDEIEPMKKSLYTSKRDDQNPFEMAGGENEDKPPMALAPSGMSLNAWHTRVKDRFQIADLLESYCSDKIRVAGGEAEGSVHIECPFEHEHSEEGGTACMAINALDSESEFWTWFCHHDSCQSRHKLEFVEEALRQNWFDESLLEDEEFVMDAGEEEPEPDADGVIPLQLESEEQAKEACEGIDWKGAESFAAKVIASAPDPMQKTWAIEAVQGATKVGKPQVKKLFSEIEQRSRAKLAAQRRREAEEEREKARQDPAPYVPLEEATPASVMKAAENAGWLPSTYHYKDGWFFDTNFEDPAKSRRVCAGFEVPFIAYGEGETRTNEVTIRYVHRSASHGVVESTFRLGEVYNDGRAFLARMVDEGLEVDPQATDSLIALFRSVNADDEARLVHKSGWHGDTYVSPTGEAFNAAGRFVLKTGLRVSSETQGTLEEHHEAATAALTGRNGELFLPGYLSGAVGCLVDRIENDLSPILCNEGTANRGKSTALKAGAAWFAVPSSEGLFMKGDATATAIENFAVRANGAVIALDEGGSSKNDAAEMQRQILQWAEGSGRGRGSRSGGVRETHTWRTCFTTSSERGFLARMAAEDSDVVTGAVSRIFTVDYDRAVILDPENDADTLEAYKTLTRDNYGVAGGVFATHISQYSKEDLAQRVSEIEAEWSDLAVGAGTRIVRFAALFRVSGELAQEAGIFGDVPVAEYMRNLLESTLEGRADHLDTEVQTLNKLKRALIAGAQRGEVCTVNEDRPFGREILAYYEEESYGKNDPDAKLRDRTYYLPLDRLPKLGIHTAPKVLAEEIGDGVIPRKKGDRSVWYHERLPGEGACKHLRVSGAFVHG